MQDIYNKKLVIRNMVMLYNTKRKKSYITKISIQIAKSVKNPQRYKKKENLST